MEDGSILGEVDLLPGEHGMSHLFDSTGTGDLDQLVEGGIGDAVLGEVEQGRAFGSFECAAGILNHF